MATYPEKEPKLPPEQQAEQPVPTETGETGMEVVGSAPTPQQAQPQATPPAPTQPVSAPAPQGPSIQIPADPAALTASSQGSTDDALTWFATFWIRMIKKALHFGWQIFKKE